MTDNELSPVCQMAEAALLAPSEMISFVDSMVAPLSLVNALLIAVGRRMRTDVSGPSRSWRTSGTNTACSGRWTMNKGIVVVGGGAAGMMAAVSAAEKGAAVTLLEPNERLGKKLNITGKGRCNVTNNADAQTILTTSPGTENFSGASSPYTYIYLPWRFLSPLASP